MREEHFAADTKAQRASGMVALTRAFVINLARKAALLCDMAFIKSLQQSRL